MNDRFESTLRTLDAATGLTDNRHRHRAEDILERILMARPVAARPPAPAPRIQRPWAAIALGGAAAVVATAVVLLASAGSGDSGMAYASWTPRPVPVPAGELGPVVEACRKQIGDEEIPLALAERRGDFVALLFHRDDPDTSTSCIARNAPGSDQVDGVESGTGGSTGTTFVPPPGRIAEGAISEYAGMAPASFVDGAIGRGVVGVTIHAGRRTIIATVADGRYAAWWPGAAFEPRTTGTTDGAGPEPALTYDVRLADGKTIGGVTPALP